MPVLSVQPSHPAGLFRLLLVSHGPDVSQLPTQKGRHWLPGQLVQFDIRTKLIYQRVPAILVQCMWRIIPYWYWLTWRTRRGIFSRLIVTVTPILARCNCHAVGQDGKLTISLGGHSDTRWNGIFRAVSFSFSFSHYPTQALMLSRILGGFNNWCRIFTQYLAAILIICTSAALVNNGSLYSTTSPLVISMSVYWSKGWI